MTVQKAAVWCYGAALFTLPWIGMGVLRLTVGRDFGGGLQPAWLFLALACVLQMLAVWRRWRVDRRPPAWNVPRTWVWATAAIAGAVLLSGLGIRLAPSGEPNTITLARFAKQVVQLAIMAFFVAWPALWTRGEQRWRWTARCLVAGALFQVGYAALQEIDYFHPLGLFAHLERIFTSNPAILSGSGELYLVDRFLQVPRLRGTACEPLYLGNYLLAVLPLVPLVGWRGRWRNLAALSCAFLLLLTWSRGAWLAALAVVTLAILLAISARRRAVAAAPLVPGGTRLLVLGAGLLLVAALVSWAVGWDGFWLPWRRLAQSCNTRDWSNLTRWYSMQAAWRAFWLSPLVGVGWGQYGWHFPLLVDPTGLQAMFSWPVVGNFPLQILCETGVIGAGVFGVVSLRLTKGFWVRFKVEATVRGRLDSPLVLTALALCGVAVQMLTFSQYNLPHIWVAWGLFLAALVSPATPAAAVSKEGLV